MSGRKEQVNLTSKLFAPSFAGAWNDYLLSDPKWCLQNGVAIPRNPIREQWHRGGRGSCKSSFISVAIVIGILTNPDVHACIFRKVGSNIFQSVYNQIRWAISMLGMDEYFEFKKHPPMIVRRDTGQTILFQGLDDPLKVKSIKPPFNYFRYLWFEELTEFDGMDEIRSVMQSVLRGGDITNTFCSYNPSPNQANWVNTEAVKEVAGRRVYRTDYRSVPKEWLGGEFLRLAESTRASNLRAYRHEYLGEITGTGSEIFENLEARKMTNEEISQFDQLRYGLDFGFENDPSALTCCHYNRKKRELYVFDEWVAHGQFEEQIFAEIERRKLKGKIIVADSAEPRSIARLQQMGARHIVKSWKAAGSGNDGLKWMRSLRKIYIDPDRCPVAYREFSQYEFDKMRDGTPRNEYPDRDNHTIDAIRYSLENEIRYGDAPRKWGVI